MPPRISTFRRLLPVSSRSPIGLSYCPACTFWRLSGLQTPHQDGRRSPVPRVVSRSRRSSTVASTTAIHATRELPPEYRELHETLSELRSKAANYVNLSRLQLALRGLESRDAVIRVAVLGLNDQAAARRLIRILLADPLAPEQPWEKQIETVGVSDRRGLLLRYGEEAGTNLRSPLLSTLAIPSSTLRSHNLEILISSVIVNSIATNSMSTVAGSKEAFLVPALETATSTRGRSSTVTYPVHQALVFGEGIESAVAYARFTAGQDMAQVSNLVKVAIGMDVRIPSAEEGEVSTVNLAAAETAIKTFRNSLDNSIAYEHGWLGSGMSKLAEWLVQGSHVSDGALNPAVRALAQSILDDTIETIKNEELHQSAELAATAVPASTRQTLHALLKTWVEQAHTELRDELDLAFSSRRWRRLSWWKLFWRVDDVSMIASEVLERSWLVEAEKEIIWLVGRITQAGLLKDISEDVGVHPPATRKQREPQSLGQSPPPPTLNDLIPKSALLRSSSTTTTATTSAPSDSDIDASRIPPPRPWPLQIPLARHSLCTSTLPPLQSLGLSLVIQTLQTLTVTSALSALVYVSVSSTSVYEAGAIAALGTVWALRRMQTVWEQERRRWEGEVRETGRGVLRDVEAVVAGVVVGDREDGGGLEGKDRGLGVGGEERRVAMEAVRKVEDVLEKM